MLVFLGVSDPSYGGAGLVHGLVVTSGGARKILTLALQGEGFNTQVVNLIWCFNIVLHRRDSGSFSVSQAASPAVPNEPSAVLACGAAAPEAPPNSQIVRDLE